MESLKEALLKHYQLSEADYASLCLPPDVRSLPFIDKDAATISAKQRILEALAKKEKILIYGDYDCDGIMATSILTYAFDKLSYKVAHYIPSRYNDGYGLTMDNAVKIAQAGYNLIILVDNGVSCEKEVSYLLSKGIESIIIDHHELPLVLPPSLSLIHPTTLHYGQYPVSAGYLSFLFATALLDELDPYLLILGALSTISDMMPLKGHNREIVRLALHYLSLYPYPTIQGLTKRTFIDEDVLSLEIIPKINAVGRIVEDSSVNRTVTYFAFPNGEKRDALAAWMDENNTLRKTLSLSALEGIEVDASAPAIFVLGSLKEGLNGLLANRLLQTYHKPIAVLSPSAHDPNAYVGSIRSQEGFLFPEFAAYASDKLLRYGGHGFAGGFSIEKSKLAEFKAAFMDYAASHPLQEVKEEEIPLALKDINPVTFDLVASFGPFGFDHKKPTFVLEDIDTSVLSYSRDENHISTPLGPSCRVLGFSMPKSELSKAKAVDLHGQFALGEWKGKSNIEFRLKGWNAK